MRKENIFFLTFFLPFLPTFFPAYREVCKSLHPLLSRRLTYCLLPPSSICLSVNRRGDFGDLTSQSNLFPLQSIHYVRHFSLSYLLILLQVSSLIPTPHSLHSCRVIAFTYQRSVLTDVSVDNILT